MGALKLLPKRLWQALSLDTVHKHPRLVLSGFQPAKLIILSQFSGEKMTDLTGGCTGGEEGPWRPGEDKGLEGFAEQAAWAAAGALWSRHCTNWQPNNHQDIN